MSDYDIMHVAAPTDLSRKNTSPWNNIPALLIRLHVFLSLPCFALLYFDFVCFRCHTLTHDLNHVGKSGRYSMKARTFH
jgi:hypothetical protein